MKVFSKYIIVSTGQKGGSGKSTFLSTIADVLRSEQRTIAVFDGDGSIGSLSDMHGTRDEDGKLLMQQDPRVGVGSYDIRSDSRITLINSLALDTPHILHDLAGGSLVELQRIFADQDGLTKLFRALHSVDACIVFCHVITPDIGTVDSVRMTLDLIQNLGDLSSNARHIAVLNRHGGRRDDAFPLWFGETDTTGNQRGGKTRARLSADGGLEMDLPGLEDRLMARMQQRHLSFTQACNDPSLMIDEQIKSKLYLEDFKTSFRPEIRQIMGLD